jgi:hypothetical protein
MTTARRAGGGALPLWKQVVTPHDDIVSGNLSMDTYAVNLGKVVQGDPNTRPIYRDPQLFFGATYLTVALKNILRDVLSVLAGSSGDRVLQLRTPFGGGKTHTLLSLYHITKSRDRLRNLPDLQDLVDPGRVNIAVFSGMETGAADNGAQRPQTLWGEIAFQLGGPEGYSLVYEQDRQKVAPGAAVISQLIGDRPTLLLLDEVLAYVENARAIGVGESNLGQQTIIFLQRLTEAVAASSHAAMVYSLQDSAQEAGGNQDLLNILGKIVQRLNIVREPVSGDEVLRVVQTRLFADLGPDIDRNSVANAYASSYYRYLSGGGARDAQSKADQLRERILNSYPFHPSLLDLMNERWNSLPSYQRTRGALQFLAVVVYTLWKENVQTQPLISPGDVPLSDMFVRTTFLSQVGEHSNSGYDAVIQADILGPQAGAKNVDEAMRRDSPNLASLTPGMRIAITALLYSFDGRGNQERGLFEVELLGFSLLPGSPGLDRSVLQTALHDLNDKLLYLHQQSGRYRFETQPNLNKLIIDYSQRWNIDEINTRMHDELDAAIRGPADASGRRPALPRDAVIWPEDTANVPDKLPLFQIVYLSPQWLDRYLEWAAQERSMRHYIEFCGTGPRSYHNALALAMPERRIIEQGQNSIRLLLTLELLQSQVEQLQMTPQQKSDLAERKKRAEGEIRGSFFSLLYQTVYTPVESDQSGQIYRLERLEVQSRSADPTKPVHTRIKEALGNHIVFDNLQPGRIVSLSRLNEQEPVELQFFAVSDLVTGFFGYYKWTHIWNESVIRQAIVKGIKECAFAYVANVRKDAQSRLLLGSATTNPIHFGDEIRPDELDMGEGAFLLSAAYAQQLLAAQTPPAPEPEPSPVSSSGAPAQGSFYGFGTPPRDRTVAEEPASWASRPQPEATTPPLFNIPPSTRPVGPGQGGHHYNLHMRITIDQFFDVMQALERLSALSSTMEIVVQATSKPDETFTQNRLHNTVVEPMVESSDVEVLKEQVEE